MRKLYIISIILFILISMGYIFFDTFYRMQMLSTELTTKRKGQEYGRISMELKNYLDIVYSVVDSLYNRSSDVSYIEKNFGDNLKNAIGMSEIILQQKLELVKQRKLSIKKAQQQAIDEIGEIRFNDGEGYIWIVENIKPFPKMVMNPMEPSEQGKILDDPKYNDPNTGRNLFDKLHTSIEKGIVEFFVNHQWKKDEEDEEIISTFLYIKLFSEWNWIIGTGVNVQDIIEDGLDNIKEIIRAMRYNDGTGYFWIIDISNEAFPKYIMHPFSPERENKFLEDGLQKYKARVDNFIQVAKKNNGEGFVEYKGEKPTAQGFISGVDKLTYIRVHEKSHWLIGTGTYIDSIDITINKVKKYFAKKTEEILFRLGVLNLTIFLVALLIFALILLKGKISFFSSRSRVKVKSVKK